jgi:hypothetical protein
MILETFSEEKENHLLTIREPKEGKITAKGSARSLQSRNAPTIRHFFE